MTVGERARRAESAGGKSEERRGLDTTVKIDGKDGRADAIPEEMRRMLALLQERLNEAERAGEAVLRLEPGDVKRLCSEAGVEEDAVGAFRALVRSNLVRLRGRWREGVSGVTAPVYVARLTEWDHESRGLAAAGRSLRRPPEGTWRYGSKHEL